MAMRDQPRKLTPEETALVVDLRRALAVSSQAFVEAVNNRDWPRAERWAGISFAIVALTEGELADA